MPPCANRTDPSTSTNPDPATDQNAPDHTPPAPLATDIANPSVTVRRIENVWKDHADLDLARNNWVTWHQHIILVLQLSGGLDLYLDGLVPEPDSDLEPRACINWMINDRAVCAFMKTHCSPTELAIIANCRSALVTWTTLKTRHERQGTVSQIQLMQEAFNVRYTSTKPLAETSEELRLLNERIWAMGPPTPDSFLVILMVLALSAPEFRGIHDAVITGLASATITAPYTAAHIRSRLDLKQQVRNADVRLSPPYTSSINKALAAHTKPSSRQFCINCKKEGHTIDYCIQAGGKMASQPLKNAWAAEKSS